MTVVRELVARLGFQVDKGGFKEAEKALATVRKAAGAASSAAGAASSAVAQGAARGRAAVAAAGAAAGGTGAYRDAKGRLRNATTGRFMGAGGAAAAAGAAASGGGLEALGKLAATVGLSAMIHEVIELGSRAEETQNVLSAVFGGQGAAQVNEWAQQTAVDVGRSKYALAEMAGQLGAVATPMLGNADRAREMSESYAKLAVDMASFYNSSDEEALLALRSAMTGEVESIKKYGVVMNDATLTEYAHTQGIKKKISAMTNAEKTELRYGYIMKVTKAAQGDAARTGDGFANSIKRIKSMMTDFGTDMGRSVLPKIEKLLVYTRDGINWFREMTQGTHLLEAAMLTLSAVVGVLAAEMVAPFILPAIAIAALTLLLDDLYNMFTGGQSVIGDFIDSMFGIGATEAVVYALGDAWSWVSETIGELQQTMPDFVGTWEMAQGVLDDLGFSIQTVLDKLRELADSMAKGGAVGWAARKAGQALGLVGQDDAEGRAVGRGLDADTMSFGDQLKARQDERGERIRGEVNARAAAREQRQKKREADRQIAELEAKLPSLTGEDRTAAEAALATARSESALLGGDESGEGRRFGVARRRMPPPPSLSADAISAEGFGVSPATVGAPAAAASAAPVVNQSNATVINVNGGDLAAVKKVVQDTINANNRRAAAAIPRAGGA